jgi:hypothetical protein
MKRPRPISAKLPGSESAPSANQSRRPKKPLVVRAANAVGDEAGDLAAMGHSAAKSAGHKAHDILHGIFG